MTKNESKPSIQCSKCRKWIEYNYSSGYSHHCSGRAEEIRRAMHKMFYSVNSFRNRDARFFGMHDIADDLNSASVVYNPEVNKLLRKEIEMKKTATDLPTPKEAARAFETLDLAKKLDSTVVAKLSSSKGKNSTPKIGELCGMDLLIDLSNAPDEAKYELYFKARTVFEDIMKKEVKESRP